MEDLANIESRIGMRFPDEHRRAILDGSDPIHQCCDFLVPESPYRLLDIVHANEFLHGAEHPDPWPTFLVAFASNGCGDYFAYDNRSNPPSVIYMDPDSFVAENLAATDALTFDSFDAWYTRKLSRSV